jgi:DNA adenine methylase Dam
MSLRPFLTWVGGKRRAAEDILAHIEAYTEGPIELYVEPFLGGGAVFLRALCENALDLCDHIALSDTNPGLIVLWSRVLWHTEELIAQYNEHVRKAPDFADSTNEYAAAEAYYNARRRDYNSILDRLEHAGDADLTKLASLLLWINGACHSGLYRTTRGGVFNTPVRKDGTFSARDVENIRAIARLAGNLRGEIELTVRSYEDALDAVDGLEDYGDPDHVVIYMDPPYLGKSIDTTESKPFVGYTAAGFDIYDQAILASHMLRTAGSHVMMYTSNANNRETQKLYGLLTQYQIADTRNISRSAKTRGKVKDLLVLNHIAG